MGVPENIPSKKTFKRNERLKSRDTIVSLFSKNQNLRIYPFKLVYNFEPGEEPFNVKVGVSASKRLFKTAVARNALKRRMREAYRLNKELIKEPYANRKGTLSFMIIYTAKDIVPFSEFNLRIKQLLIRLVNKIEPNVV